MKTLHQWMSRRVTPQQLTYSDAAFELTRAELSAERSSSGYTLLRFAAIGQRHNADGAYVVERVTALLLRQDCTLVRVQRYHESKKPFVLGSQIAWSHEFGDAELADAAAVVYLIETRLHVMRSLLGGELGPTDLVAESATWPIVSRQLEPSDLMHADIALSTRRGERVDISLFAECGVPNRSVSFAAEVYFLDSEGTARASAVASGSLVNGFTCERTDTGIDRSTAAEIRSVAVRFRIETTVISELGAIMLPEHCRIVR